MEDEAPDVTEDEWQDVADEQPTDDVERRVRGAMHADGMAVG